MLNNQRVANPAHLVSVCQNTHYSVLSLKSTQPEKLIDKPDFFGKCSNFLKVFDRIQVINVDELIILEYIVQSIDPHNLKVKTLKLSKLDLINGTYIHNIFKEQVPKIRTATEAQESFNNSFQTKLAPEKKDNK